jgi:tRNA pseudouridine(55) synthase
VKKYVTLHKAVGKTPLQVLDAYKEQHKLPQDLKLAYAGRLDPMASGKLLVLIGDECQKQHTHYLDLDKEYVFEVLFGFQTDSGDVLGMASHQPTQKFPDDKLRQVTKKFIGPVSFPYPKFSSKTVKGKPLFLWTLENRLEEIEIPYRDSIIYSLDHLSSQLITATNLHAGILAKINSLPPVTESSKARGNDFRRPEILPQWEKLFANISPNQQFQIARFKCRASSGTYMRTLAEKIAHELDTIGLAYSIDRTQIGRFKKFGPVGFWIKKF